MEGKDFHYTVRGTWPFPLDMLRRDRSRAATQQDQAKIDLLSREFAPERGESHEKVEINLVIPDAGPRERPMSARWESFRGWEVTTDNEYKHLRADAAERQRRAKLRDQALAKLTDEEKEALAWFAPGLGDISK